MFDCSERKKMRKLKKANTGIDKRYLTLEDGQERWSLGQTTLRRLAKEAGAWIEIGRSRRIDVPRMDDYLDSMNE